MSEKIKFEGNGSVWNYETDSPLVEFKNGFAEVDADVAAQLDAKGYKRAGVSGEQPQATAATLGLSTDYVHGHDLGSVEFAEDLGTSSDSDELDITHNKRGRKPKHD